MIRCAHPFGAILRMFSALRAPSGFRRNDGEGMADIAASPCNPTPTLPCAQGRERVPAD